jgi:hypothetical protein
VTRHQFRDFMRLADREAGHFLGLTRAASLRRPVSCRPAIRAAWCLASTVCACVVYIRQASRASTGASFAPRDCARAGTQTTTENPRVRPAPSTRAALSCCRP